MKYGNIALAAFAAAGMSISARAQTVNVQEPKDNANFYSQTCTPFETIAESRFPLMSTISPLGLRSPLLEDLADLVIGCLSKGIRGGPLKYAHAFSVFEEISVPIEHKFGLTFSIVKGIQTGFPYAEVEFHYGKKSYLIIDGAGIDYVHTHAGEIDTQTYEIKEVLSISDFKNPRSSIIENLFLVIYISQLRGESADINLVKRLETML
jgi:hypothetical protein